MGKRATRVPPTLWTTLALLVLPLPCCVCRPEPAELAQVLEASFRTPERTFATFQAAVAEDLQDLEYRCLSAAFRRREGVTQIVYREFRRELLAREPWLRRVSCAEVIAARELDG
jgi:hypothetical protein